VRVAASHPGLRRCLGGAEVRGGGSVGGDAPGGAGGAPGRCGSRFGGGGGARQGKSVRVRSPATGSPVGYDRLTAIADAVDVPAGKHRIEVLRSRRVATRCRGRSFCPRSHGRALGRRPHCARARPFGGRVRSARSCGPRARRAFLKAVRPPWMAPPRSLPWIQVAGGQTAGAARSIRRPDTGFASRPVALRRRRLRTPGAAHRHRARDDVGDGGAAAAEVTEGVRHTRLLPPPGATANKRGLTLLVSPLSARGGGPRLLPWAHGQTRRQAVDRVVHPRDRVRGRDRSAPRAGVPAERAAGGWENYQDPLRRLPLRKAGGGGAGDDPSRRCHTLSPGGCVDLLSPAPPPRGTTAPVGRFRATGVVQSGRRAGIPRAIVESAESGRAARRRDGRDG
jgi:hypothetical protein